VGADVSFGEAQPLGQHDGLAILAQDIGIRPAGMMERHAEQAELHGRNSSCKGRPAWRMRAHRLR
jgi:hypothetical protein